jgi:hypothetical protein
MEKKKILMTGLVIVTMVFATFAPVTKIVWAGSTDTLVITFQFKCNISIDVNASSYNFSVVWANSQKSTSGTRFTIFNNGTISPVAVDVNITSPPAGLTCVSPGPPLGSMQFSLLGLSGSVASTPWYSTSAWSSLTSLAKGTPQTFGLKLYASNITANTSWLSMTVTYRAT